VTIRRILSQFFVVAVELWSIAVAILSAQPTPSGAAFLSKVLGFSPQQARALDLGVAVVRSSDSLAREEVSQIGAIRIAAEAERFIDQFRDIEQFEKGPGIPQIGRISSPPQPNDFGALRVPASDIDALRTCRPGDCDVKLSAEAMKRFRTEVDWSSARVTSQVDAVAHTMLVELVRAYQADGNLALGRYDDEPSSLSVTAQLQALTKNGPALPAPVPALLAYLESYPRGRPASAEDFFYWTVVDFGLKRTIRVNHVTIYPLEAHLVPKVSHAIAIKQIYATHYFHTTLELRFLVDDDPLANRGFFLVSIIRSRNDGMIGFKGLFLRPIIIRRSRDAVRGYLEHVKRQMEPRGD
jgi:hypothetical protein